MTSTTQLRAVIAATERGTGDAPSWLECEIHLADWNDPRRRLRLLVDMAERSRRRDPSAVGWPYTFNAQLLPVNRGHCALQIEPLPDAEGWRLLIHEGDFEQVRRALTKMLEWTPAQVAEMFAAMAVI
jgi:hypothetical protein